MKGHRFINAQQSIACYMVAFETNRMTYAEFNNWSHYLEKVLTTKDCQVIVFYGKRYLEELRREDDGFLFDIKDSLIRLADGKSKYHLDEHILSYVDYDILSAILLDASSGYKQVKESDELGL